MKKYVTASLFIFWAIIVAVIAAGLVSRNGDEGTAVGFNINGTIQSSNVTGIDPSASTLVLSSVELAKHNSSQSCWLLISGKIYDVTTYLNQHPGNASTILPSCGIDATQAYDTKGSRGRPHSGNANAMLADYFIGNLNQNITVSPANLPNSTSTTSPTPIPGRNSENND